MFRRAFSGAYFPFFPTPCPLTLPLRIRVLFFEDMRSRLLTHSSDFTALLLLLALHVFSAF